MYISGNGRFLTENRPKMLLFRFSKLIIIAGTPSGKIIEICKNSIIASIIQLSIGILQSGILCIINPQMKFILPLPLNLLNMPISEKRLKMRQN